MMEESFFVMPGGALRGLRDELTRSAFTTSFYRFCKIVTLCAVEARQLAKRLKTGSETGSEQFCGGSSSVG